MGTLLIAGGSGCAAYKATQQPDKKDLSVLNPGTPRSRMIAELGAPLMSEVREGDPVDLFAFRQGYTKGAKAGRALAHGTADVFTGGLWEVVGIPAEALADGKTVKVEVIYDDRHEVRRIDVIEGQNVITPKRWLGLKSKSKAEPAATAEKSEPAKEPG